MTLFDVDRLHKFWGRNPPQGILLMAIARCLGIEYKSPVEKAQVTSADTWMQFVKGTKKGSTLGIGAQ
jgi:hypothetical protein